MDDYLLLLPPLVAGLSTYGYRKPAIAFILCTFC